MKPRIRVKAGSRPALAVVPTNVVRLPVITTHDVDSDRVLAAAYDAQITDVIVIGHTRDGDEYFASSQADGGDVLWQLERAKKRLLQTVEQIQGAA